MNWRRIIAEGVRLVTMLVVALAVRHHWAPARPSAHNLGAPLNPWLGSHDIWYDPANSSTVANDNNTCASSAAPCLTLRQIMIRLGGPSPVISPWNGQLTIHLMSNNVGHDAPVTMLPYGPLGVLFSFEGVVSIVATCTITAVTDRNTAAAVGTQTQITASCPTTPGQFVVNNTNPSAAFVKSWSAGSGVVTQPLTRCDVATNTCPRTEVNNWAVNDSISVETFPTLGVDVAGELNSSQGGGAFGFTHITFGANSYLTGQLISLWEDSQVASIHVNTDSEYGESLNYYMPNTGSFDFHVLYGANINNLFHGLVPAVYGGIYQNGADIESVNFGLGVDLENYITVSGVFNDVYLGVPGAGGQGVNLAATNSNFVSPSGAGGGLIWGPGHFNVMPGATLGYQTGQAATVFHNGQVAAGGRGFVAWPGTANNATFTQALWCATNTGGANPVGTNCGIQGTAANFDLAWGSGGCGGNCFFPGGYGLVGYSQ